MPQPRQGLGLLLGRGPAVPGGGGLAVPLHAPAPLIQQPQIILGFGLSLTRRQIKPAGRFSGVGGHAAPLLQHAAVIAHTRGVPRLG